MGSKMELILLRSQGWPQSSERGSNLPEAIQRAGAPGFCSLRGLGGHRVLHPFSEVPGCLYLASVFFPAKWDFRPDNQLPGLVGETPGP